MIIPNTVVREAWGRNALGVFPEARLNLSDFLETIDGVEILEKMETADCERCAWYIFRNEEWYKRLDSLKRGSVLIGKRGIGFLRSVGYSVKKNPLDNDVVAYGSRDTRMINHYGKYCGGRVVSKIGTLHVVKHDLEVVPDFYGDIVTFLRRRD